jgi:hypothetical protein
VLRALCRLQASSGAAGGPPESPAPTRDRGSHATRADRSRSRRDSAGPSRQGIRRSVGDRTSLRSEGSGCRRCAFDLRGAAETTSLVDALVGRPSGSPPLPSSPSSSSRAAATAQSLGARASSWRPCRMPKICTSRTVSPSSSKRTRWARR